MQPDRTPARKSGQLADDLRVQAWLAKAEIRNPSLRQDVSALAQLRDDLRLQLHLGKMEASEAWQPIEAEWPRLIAALQEVGEEAEEEAKRLVEAIRKAYHRMTTGA